MRLLALVLILPWASQACPQVVSSLCRCQDLHNGVALNCSDADGATVVTTLKAHQAQLGLIQDLIMHRANIRSLPASFFAGLYIKRIDLSYNRLSLLDEAAFAGMAPVLQELSLTHNNLTAIPAAALKELKTLLKLDLSNNTLTDLQPESALPTLPKLYDLNLAYNKICSIHKNVFIGIRDNVQTINLGHNCLSAVPAPAIRNFKQLMSLHMHSNEITSLDALSFMNLPVMNLLNLAANKINDIKPQAFLNVPNLRYLYLTDNHISALSANQFAAFEQLEMLDLTNNYIEVVPKNTFTGLGQLRQLYMGSNRIGRIEQDAFVNSTIVILILASNNLTSLDEGVLNGLPNLQQLSIKDNKLEAIHQNALYNNPALAMIDLSGNRLSEVPQSTFFSQLNLLLVDLSKNKITKTPYSAFSRRIGTVLLQENPLVCTEKVHMLQDGVGVYIPNSDDVICGGKPKTTTTTTTTTAAPLPQAPILPKNLLQHQQEATETIENFLKAQNIDLNGMTSQQLAGISGQIPISLVQGGKPADSTPPDLTPEVSTKPIRPVNDMSSLRPSILNMRPTNTITRSRTHNFSGEISSHLPSRPQSKAISTAPLNATQPPPPLPAQELPAEPPLSDGGIVEETQLSQEEEDALVRALASIPVPATLQPPVKATTDIADNPNIIHPFPVPFLKRGPNLSSSSRVKEGHDGVVAATGEPSVPSRSQPVDRIAEDIHQPVAVPVETPTVRTHTLHPSIVLAPARPASLPPSTAVSENAIEQNFAEFALKTQSPDEIATSSVGKVKESKVSTSTLIIAVCLSTVGVCMALVFVGLCIAKHRQMRRLGSTSSDSTTARTNAYVAAQQAHMNMIYGTLNRRSMSMARPEEQPQPWIYSPSTYCNSYYNK